MTPTAPLACEDLHARWSPSGLTPQNSFIKQRALKISGTGPRLLQQGSKAAAVEAATVAVAVATAVAGEGEGVGVVGVGVVGVGVEEEKEEEDESLEEDLEED